jgi:hypothetical protein
MDKTAGVAKLVCNLTDRAPLCSQPCNLSDIHGDTGSAKLLSLSACIPQTSSDTFNDQARGTKPANGAANATSEKSDGPHKGMTGTVPIESSRMGTGCAITGTVLICRPFSKTRTVPGATIAGTIR